MRVEALVPDAPVAQPAAGGDASEFGKILDDAGAVLQRAARSEDAFASGTGDLQNAVYERARADVVLSVATAAAQRTVQAINTVLNMQV
ncbi:MAG: flagellar hook-basal body complex protein FliE [Vulcanimicrobiaceae bacterium]